MQANVVSRLLGVVICLLILHGCSQAPERTLPPTDDPLSERAAESMAAGDFGIGLIHQLEQPWS